MNEGTVYLPEERYLTDKMIPYKCDYAIVSYATKAIEEGAFSDKDIKQIRLDDRIEEITPWAFAGSDAEIIFPESLELICEKAFKQARVGNEIYLGYNLKGIGESAFEKSGVKIVHLENGLERMNSYAFAECPYLEKINFPASLESIPDYACFDCKYLTDIEISDGVQYIGKGAFAGTAIETIRIPYTVKYIDEYAFACCPNLKEVFIENDDIKLLRNVFKGCPNIEMVHTPNKIFSKSEILSEEELDKEISTIDKILEKAEMECEKTENNIIEYPVNLPGDVIK